MSDTAAVESPDLPIFASGMKIQLKTAAAVLAGVGIGVLAMHGLQGGQAKAPPAFVISNIEVTDPSGYQKIWGGSGGLREWQMTNYK